MKHFRISIIVTIVLMGLAGWWGYNRRTNNINSKQK